MLGVGEKMSSSEQPPQDCAWILPFLSSAGGDSARMGRWQSDAVAFEKRQTAKWLRCEPFERPVLWVSTC